MKTCKQCGASKPVTDFYRNKNSVESRCKLCRNARAKAWYAGNKAHHRELVRSWLGANPERVVEIRKRHQERLAAFVRELKESAPCQDCGNSFRYWVMHFDHRPDEVAKVTEVSWLASHRATWTQLKAEIAKCDLVCAVCHAHRTYCRAHNIPHYVLT